jgi:hypothetical protein
MQRRYLELSQADRRQGTCMLSCGHGENRRATYWRDIQEEQSSKLVDYMSTITGPAPVSAKVVSTELIVALLKDQRNEPTH